MNNSEKNYREILQNSLNRINDEIILLETQNNKLLNIITSSVKRIERLRIEKEQIQKELKSRSSLNQTKVEGVTKEFIDDRIESITKKQGTHSQGIRELESLRKEVNSNLARSIIDRRIRHERKKISRLKGAKNLISDVQKAMIMSKYIVERYKLGKFAKRQGNVNYYENKVAETEHKQSLLNPEESIVDKVQSVYYDKKGKYYAKRLDQANKKLEKLQRKGVQNRILGANVAVMNKKDTDKLRKRMDQHKDKKNEQNDSIIINPEKKQLPLVISQSQIPEDITAESLAEIAVNGESKTSMNQNTRSTKVA